MTKHFYRCGDDLYYVDGGTCYKLGDSWIKASLPYDAKGIKTSEALTLLMSLDKKMPTSLFKEGELLASELSYEVGRLLENFQWDEANFDVSELKKKISDIKNKLATLGELYD